MPLPVDIAALNSNVPPVVPPPPTNPGRDREAQLLRRVRELEDELRGVRTENEKQVRIPHCVTSLVSQIQHFNRKQ